MRSRNACDSDDDKGRRVLGGGLRWEARHVGAGIMMNDCNVPNVCVYLTCSTSYHTYTFDGW